MIIIPNVKPEEVTLDHVVKAFDQFMGRFDVTRYSATQVPQRQVSVNVGRDLVRLNEYCGLGPLSSAIVQSNQSNFDYAIAGICAEQAKSFLGVKYSPEEKRYRFWKCDEHSIAEFELWRVTNPHDEVYNGILRIDYRYQNLNTQQCQGIAFLSASEKAREAGIKPWLEHTVIWLGVETTFVGAYEGLLMLDYVANKVLKVEEE